MYHDCGEGPFPSHGSAVEFANAEVGLPWRVQQVRNVFIIEVDDELFDHGPHEVCLCGHFEPSDGYGGNDCPECGRAMRVTSGEPEPVDLDEVWETVPVVEDRYRVKARELLVANLDEDDVFVSENATVSVADDGAWVDARIWIPGDDHVCDDDSRSYDCHRR